MSRGEKECRRQNFIAAALVGAVMAMTVHAETVNTRIGKLEFENG